MSLCEGLDSYERRSEAVDAVLQSVRQEGSLSCLKGWRDEVSDGTPVPLPAQVKTELWDFGLIFP